MSPGISIDFRRAPDKSGLRCAQRVCGGLCELVDGVRMGVGFHCGIIIGSVVFCKGLIMGMSSVWSGIIVLAVICVAACGGELADGDLEGASWIWTGPKPTAVGEWECYSRKEFVVDGNVVGASVLISGDNVYELYFNGRSIGEDGGG